MRPQPRRAGPEIVDSASSSSDEYGDVDVDHDVIAREFAEIVHAQWLSVPAAVGPSIVEMANDTT